MANESTKTCEYRYGSAEASEHQDYILPQVFQLLGNGSGRSILDLGCGNGAVAHEMAQRGFEVMGIDSSQSGIAHAKASYPDCTFRVGDVTVPAPELGGRFDFVVALETIEHLLDPRAMLRLARASLRPGGRVILSTPYHGYLKNLALAITGRMDEHFTVLWDGGHVKFFSVKTLSKMLEDEGFRVLQFRFGGRAPLLAKSMICVTEPAPAPAKQLG